ncbi:myeloid-associated differentiation marker homolog [Betta splendens]|uniref:Myeloid-associated differentiation marker homolog n=1 Tax=Betta splendens TaxID=158456 RepID=A0A6P7N460_BETSP|nr:myeloid-associated differentiation marker homolog [Betta splendens]
MATVDVKTLTAPVGIVRLLEVVFTCVTFSLAASATTAFWVWCMFSWGFCFSITFLVLLLELIRVHAKLPISWTDFTTAFAMLATLMVLAASIIFPVSINCSTCGRQIGATITSILAFILYAVEVGLTRAKTGELSGFLSTVPGLLKVLEAFVACIIFICLGNIDYYVIPWLQWCVTVYSICFIFTLLVIILTIFRLLALSAPLKKVLTCCNVLAVLMYMTAVVAWPLYSIRNTPRPSPCPRFCLWDNLVVITFMTGFNLIAYIIDTVYLIRDIVVMSMSVSI